MKQQPVCGLAEVSAITACQLAKTRQWLSQCLWRFVLRVLERGLFPDETEALYIYRLYLGIACESRAGALR